MRLSRYDSSKNISCTRKSRNLEVGYSCLYYDFSRFGEGDKRRPSFNVRFEWDDVEDMINTFSKENHPKAMRIKKALSILETVEALNASDHVHDKDKRLISEQIPEKKTARPHLSIVGRGRDAPDQDG